MSDQVIFLPTHKTDPQLIRTFSRLIVLGLRLLDLAILILFAAAIFYFLETILP